MPSVNGQFEHEDVSQDASSEYIMKALMPIQSTNESKLVITAIKIVSTLQSKYKFFLNHCLHEILRPLSTLLRMHSHWCTGGSFD